MRYGSLRAIIKAVLCKFTPFPLIEFCHRCGVRQPLVWWTEPDGLYSVVTVDNKYAILCPCCFTKLATRKNVYVRWTVQVMK